MPLLEVSLATKRYDIISSLDVPCGCDVVVMTADELATRKEVSFIKSMLQERTLVYDRE